MPLRGRGFRLEPVAGLVEPRVFLESLADGVFLSTVSVQQKRVRVVEGKGRGHVELEGSPDMVLEVVSPSSVEKDIVILRQAYWEAGIPEYWLVDARAEPLKFDILRHTAKYGHRLATFFRP